MVSRASRAASSPAAWLGFGLGLGLGLGFPYISPISPLHLPHISQVGDCLTMGQEVVGCERSASGAVAGVLADGTTLETDLLVG